LAWVFQTKERKKERGATPGVEIIIDLPFGFPINNIISLRKRGHSRDKRPRV